MYISPIGYLLLAVFVGVPAVFVGGTVLCAVAGLVHGLVWSLGFAIYTKAKRLLLVGLALVGLACQTQGPDASPDAGACAVATTDVIAYQDCRTKTADGFECVTGCGRLPDDGGLGTLLGDGCTVQIGTSTPVTGICVSSCSVCQ